MEPVIGAEQRHALEGVVGSRVIELPLRRPEVAEDQLGLTHNPVQAVELTRDKAAMRQRLTEVGVPQPRRCRNL